MSGKYDGYVVTVNGRRMEYSERTECKVCGSTRAGMDDMCPNRDNVCKYCCVPCIEWGNCLWGTGEGETRDSLEHTLDFESTNTEQHIRAFIKFYQAIGAPIPVESRFGLKLLGPGMIPLVEVN